MQLRVANSLSSDKDDLYTSDGKARYFGEN